MRSPYTAARISPEFRASLNMALQATKERESDLVRASVEEFLMRHKTAPQIQLAVKRSLRRAL